MPGTRSRSRSAARPASFAPPPRERWVLPPRAHDALPDLERTRLLDLTREVLRRPTAPYAEDLQVRGLLEFAAARPGITARLDRHGNALLEWRGRRTRAPLLAYSAHLDHPGVEFLGRRGGVLLGRLHGGVRSDVLPGAPLRFFSLEDGADTATARVRAARRVGGNTELELVEMRGRSARGAPGMWDLGAGNVRGTRLHARVCDDLLGAVSILHVLDRLWRARSPARLLGVFTRAEETGFVGCLGLLEARALPDGTRVIGLECSPLRATARPGRGPVVRVGDAASVFDPELSQRLHAEAARLRAEIGGFGFQRALMDGGRCESTAYNARGVRAGAACLALGNYHNGSPRGRLEPEWVEWADHEGLAALLYEFALSWNAGANSAHSAALAAQWRSGRAQLARSALRIHAATTRA
jgi:putative aminopeptidase FrvX